MEIRSKYPTIKDFCDRFSKENVFQCTQKPTKCLTCSAPSLTYINITYGEGNAIAWLVYILTFFQENINVPYKMSQYQIETCAQTIFEQYKYLKATEIMLFFARLAGGMYPVDWKGYITPDKIVSALRNSFMPWRNDLLDKIERNKKEQEPKIPTMTWDQYRQMVQQNGETTIHENNPLIRL